MPDDNTAWGWLWRAFGLDPNRDYDAERVADVQRRWREYQERQDQEERKAAIEDAIDRSPAGALENMRQSFAGSGQETKAVSSDNKATAEKPGTKTLDYIALGLLLAPPAVVFEIFIKGDPIDWRRTAIATIVAWIVGGFVVLASHRWQSWRFSDWRVWQYLLAAESRFWVKALIVAAAIGLALTLRSFLSTEPSSSPQGSFTQQEVDEKVAATTKPLNDRIAQLEAAQQANSQQKPLFPPGSNLSLLTGQQIVNKIHDLDAKAAQQSAVIDDLKQKLAEAQRNSPPTAPAPSLMNADIVLSIIQALQSAYSEEMKENGDTKLRYLAIASPADQTPLRRLLGNIVQTALTPNVAIVEPPDTEHILDAPRLEIPNTNGIVMHGEDRLNSVLASGLQRCFVIKSQRTDDLGQKLSDFYWPNQHYLVVWLAFGSVGSPLKNPNGCN